MTKKVLSIKIETSGLDRRAHQILTGVFRVVDVAADRIVDEKRVVLGYRGDVVPSRDAIEANGIIPMGARGLSEAAAALEIRDFVLKHGGDELDVVGQMPALESSFVRSLLKRNGYDPRIISARRVDLSVEARKAVRAGRLDPERLLRRTNDTPSYSLESVARALGSPYDPAADKDDVYKSDVMLENWSRLGRPTSSEVDQSFQDPRRLEARAGKFLKVTRFSNHKGAFEDKVYYVTGGGIDTTRDQYGERNYLETVLVDMTTPEIVAEAKKRMAVGAGRGGLGKTFFEEVTSVRGLDSDEVYGVAELAEEEIPAHARDLDFAKAFGELAVKNVKDQRLSEREKFSKAVMEKAVAAGFSRVRASDNLESSLDQKETWEIPRLAREMAPLSHEARIDHIVALADQRGKGPAWAFTAFEMAEKYGSRNALPGYEEARRRRLMELLPEKCPAVVHEVDAAQCSISAATALAAQGIDRFEFSSDGRGVTILALGAEGEEVKRLSIENQTGTNGRIYAPNADIIASRLAEAFGISKQAASELRTGFSPFVDNASFEALRKEFEAPGSPAVELMREMLAKDYAAFIGEAASPKFSDEIAQAPESAGGGVISPRKKTVSDRKFFNALFEKVRGLAVADEATNIERVRANLLASNAATLKDTEDMIASEGLRLDPETKVESTVEVEGDGGEKVKVEYSDLSVQCKVCGKTVKGKNAVAGMGSTCAKKLRDALDRPDVTVMDVTAQKFRKLTELRSSDGSYPIVYIKDPATSEVFAADIIRRLPDGRYEVNDLSAQARSIGMNHNTMQDAMRLYLDPKTTEFVKIFGSSSGYYKKGRKLSA